MPEFLSALLAKALMVLVEALVAEIVTMFLRSAYARRRFTPLPVAA